jgi:hypothetical protein
MRVVSETLYITHFLNCWTEVTGLKPAVYEGPTTGGSAVPVSELKTGADPASEDFWDFYSLRDDGQCPVFRS